MKKITTTNKSKKKNAKIKNIININKQITKNHKTKTATITENSKITNRNNYKTHKHKKNNNNLKNHKNLKHKQKHINHKNTTNHTTQQTL